MANLLHLEGTRIDELPFCTSWKLRPRRRRNKRDDRRTCVDGSFAHYWDVQIGARPGLFHSHCRRCGIDKQLSVPGFSTDLSMEYGKGRLGGLQRKGVA